MKSGTTTLYRDLLDIPGLYLPDKESNALLKTDPAMSFRKLLDKVKIDHQVGEVCPDYTKPVLDERAARAAKILYSGRQPPRLIFLAREPIARLLSHHHFISTQYGDANPGGMTSDLLASLRDFPELVETSRYSARLRPWIDAFGVSMVKIVRFEDYIADREGILSMIAEFIGLAGSSTVGTDKTKAFNLGDSRPVATPGWRKVLNHPFYRRFFRPLLTLAMRDRLRSWFLPKSPLKPKPPSIETLQLLAETFKPDVAELSGMAGMKTPLWDLDLAAKQLSSFPR